MPERSPSIDFLAASRLGRAIDINRFSVLFDQVLAAQGFPNPLVKARIARHEATFIVDTGASTNVLADWFVNAAGISSAKTDTTATGVVGKAVTTRVVQREPRAA